MQTSGPRANSTVARERISVTMTRVSFCSTNVHTNWKSFYFGYVITFHFMQHLLFDLVRRLSQENIAAKTYKVKKLHRIIDLWLGFKRTPELCHVIEIDITIQIHFKCTNLCCKAMHYRRQNSSQWHIFVFDQVSWNQQFTQWFHDNIELMPIPIKKKSMIFSSCFRGPAHVLF